jgi:SAM-dependent methyltransferase
MHETSKALLRRLYDQRFCARYFVGDGVDVGCGEDNIEKFRHLFPLMRSCRGWDLRDGDAQYLASVPDCSFDFLHSSHCLEHLVDPAVALEHWLRVLKPGGHLVVMIPDEDMYEQGVFPSTFNPDHKWTFTVDKTASWSPKSVSLLRLLSAFSDRAQTVKIEQIDTTYHLADKRYDQTRSTYVECALEFVMRKLTLDQITSRGRIPADVTKARAAA